MDGTFLQSHRSEKCISVLNNALNRCRVGFVYTQKASQWCYVEMCLCREANIPRWNRSSFWGAALRSGIQRFRTRRFGREMLPKAYPSRKTTILRYIPQEMPVPMETARAQRLRLEAYWTETPSQSPVRPRCQDTYEDYRKYCCPHGRCGN